MSEDLEKIKKIKNFALNVRKNILEMSLSAGASSSHFGGALSIVEIISTLFAVQMKIDKKNSQWEDRDRFILSKGHACLAYYSALSEIGFISKDELLTFEKDDSNLLGHPVINRNLGIDFSNGSLADASAVLMAPLIPLPVGVLDAMSIPKSIIKSPSLRLA